MRTRECNSQEEEPQNLFFFFLLFFNKCKNRRIIGKFPRKFPKKKKKRGRQKKTIKTQNRKEHKTYISTTYSG
jgi:hypothetical protein